MSLPFVLEPILFSYYSELRVMVQWCKGWWTQSLIKFIPINYTFIHNHIAARCKNVGQRPFLLRPELLARVRTGGF